MRKSMLECFCEFKWYDYGASFVVILMLVIVFGNVLGRYLFSTSWAFTEEIACGLIVLMSLLGAATSARKGGFLGMDLLIDIIPRKYKKYILTVQPLTIIIFLIALTIYGYGMAMDEWNLGQKTASLRWPEAIFGAMLPIGSVFVIIGAIQRLITVWRPEDNSGAFRLKDIGVVLFVSLIVVAIVCAPVAAALSFASMDIGVILFLSFIVMIIINVPVAIALSLSSAVCIMMYGLPTNLIPIMIYSGFSKFLLLAVPFFIFAGNLMERVGISESLITFCRTLVGHRRGGLIEVAVITSCLFAAISGSGPATVAALGSFLIPAMNRDGYGITMPAALLATSGAIGTVIPPSIPFIIYGVVTNTSVIDLFMAGIIPGLLMGLALIIAGKWDNRNNPDIVIEKRATFTEKGRAFRKAIWAILMPVIILGGIYSGVFTPTEASGVACVYGLFVGAFIYRKLTWKVFIETLSESATSTGNIMMIIAGASLFSWFCSTSGITQAATNLMQQVATSEIMFLLLVNILLLIAGCFVDASCAIYIFIPIFMPICRELGYSPVALGVVTIINCAIGNVTPPVGLNLFVATSISGASLKDVSKRVWPYVFASAVVMLIVTYFPVVATFLPDIMKN